MPVACGMAAALRVKGNFTSRVYTVVGDGELSEGSIWEAMMNAVHYELGNLVMMIDYNGLEADGSIEEVTGLLDIAEKCRAFGFRVEEFDGSDIAMSKQKFDELPPADSKVATVFVWKTGKGKGISFMENQVRWHAGKLSQEQYEACMKELDECWEKSYAD